MKRRFGTVSALALAVSMPAAARQTVSVPTVVPVINRNPTTALASMADAQNDVLTHSAIQPGATTGHVITADMIKLRQRPDHFSAALDVKDLGAACDGTTDDSSRFQAAMDAGAAAGKLVVFSGTCVIHTALKETHDPAGGVFALHGLTGGVILTRNNDLFDYIAPANHINYRQAKIDFQNFDITNTGTNNTGTVVYVDCRLLANTCTKPVSIIQNIHATDLATMFNGIVVSNVHIDHNEFDRTTGVTATSFAMFQGPLVGKSQLFSAGDFLQDNMVIGGNFLLTVGGVQNIVSKFNYHLEGISGVYEVNPVGIEQLQNIGNYYEESIVGIYEPQCGFCQIEQNSFDANPLGIARDYRSIVVGAPGSPQQGAKIDHNVVFGIPNGVTANPVMYANMEMASTFDNNSVVGTIATPACMKVGSDAVAAAAVVSVAGNVCWAAGPITVFGSTVTTRGNSYDPAGSTNVRLPDRN